MALNLELVIDRKHTQSIKWDHARNYFNQSDILPMWVADMDFPAPPSVVVITGPLTRRGFVTHQV